jgi:hypothetical protein
VNRQKDVGKLRKAEFVIPCLLILLFAFVVSTHSLSADLTIGMGPASSVVDIKSLSFPIVVQNYEGLLYGASESGNKQFMKSTDDGETWTQISTLVGTPRQDAPFFVDGQGNFFLYIYPNDTVIRSTDLGVSWSTVFDFPKQGYPIGTTSKSMGFAEDNQGNLYLGVYGASNSSDIWRSIDHGVSWNLLQGFNARHIHSVQFNPYNNALYTSVGDDDTIPNMGNYKSIDYGKTWNKLSLGDYKTVALLFTENYTYFGSDDPLNGQQFIARSRNDKDFIETYLLGTNLGVEWIDGLAISPVTGVLYATATGTTEIGVKGIWASADEGGSWVPIYTVNDTLGTSYHFGGISNFANGYWFIQEDQRPYCTLRLKDMTKDQVRQLGSSLQEQTTLDGYVGISHPLINSNDYLSFPQGSLQNVQLKFTGVSIRQLVRNPSFEDGALGKLPTYWSEADYFGNNWNVTKDSSDRQFGDFSLLVSGMNATEVHGEVQETYDVFIPGSSGIIVMYSTKIANQNKFMLDLKLSIYFTDGTSNSCMGYTIKDESTNGWITTRFVYLLPKDASRIMARIAVGGQGKAWLDGLLVGVVDGESVNIINNLSWADDFLNWNTNGKFINSTNPSITISGQTISFKGQLNDSSSTNYFPIFASLSGLVPIQTSCDGTKVFRVSIMSNHSVSLLTSTPTLSPAPTLNLTSGVLESPTLIPQNTASSSVNLTPPTSTSNLSLSQTPNASNFTTASRLVTPSSRVPLNLSTATYLIAIGIIVATIVLVAVVIMITKNRAAKFRRDYAKP